MKSTPWSTCRFASAIEFVAFLARLGVQFLLSLEQLDDKRHHLGTRQHPECPLSIPIIDHHPIAKALLPQRDHLAFEVAVQVGGQLDPGPIVGFDNLLPDI